MKKSLNLRLTAGLIALFTALCCAVILNRPTRNEQVVSFTSTYGEHEVTLQGSYWENPDAEYAVLICPGYSCDRQKWRPFADLFVKNGLSVLSFDYSGQGASSGTIGFDNAKTDNIPIAIDSAIEQLCSLSGLPEEKIILVGHSMGGRAILRLLFDYNDPEAETVLSHRDIANVILMSPEVNYEYNAQASLFAGTSDAVEYPWNKMDAESIKGTNVYLYGSTADDIVSDEDVLKVYERLGGTDAPESGKCSAGMTNALGSSLTVGITGGVLHSYIMYSPSFASYVNDALSRIIDPSQIRFIPSTMSLVYISWFAGLIGLFLVLTSLLAPLSKDPVSEVPVLIDSKRYLLHKCLMWIPGIIVAFLICCITVVMPFGSPVMNTPYMCFIAGYGIVMLAAYRKGRFKGTEGKLPRPSLTVKASGRNILLTAGTVIGLSFAVWYILRASMYRLIPMNYRLFWLTFATVLMTIGYYVSGCGTDMLKNAGAGRMTRFIYSCIQYVPLFLLVGFYLALKSYSGMIGQAQNMVLMYIFCIPLGDYVKKMISSRLLGAILTAFLFQTLMITSSALISLF